MGNREVFNPANEAIDLEHDIMFVIDTRNGGNRKPFVTPRLREFFDQHPSSCQIFGLSSMATFFRLPWLVKRLGFKEGVTDNRFLACFHTVRHAFASWLALDGKIPFTINEFMGQTTAAHRHGELERHRA